MTPSRLFCLSFVTATALLVACTHADPYVWVDSYKEPAPTNTEGYLVRAGDLLNVRIWNQNEAFPPHVRVRHDGKITLPLINDVEAAGYTPPALATRIQALLKPFIQNPVVTVAVEESRPPTVSVLGEVNKPGVYPLEPGGGVLQALASAGGMTVYADRDRVFVLRHHSPAVRIRFRFEDLSRGVGEAQSFHLMDGDVVVAE